MKRRAEEARSLPQESEANVAGVPDELELLKRAPDVTRPAVSARDTTSGSENMPLVSRNVRDADPEQPISNERTLEEIVQANIAPRCVQVRIIAAFAALELLPAGIGLHGLRNLGFGPPPVRGNLLWSQTQS